MGPHTAETTGDMREPIPGYRLLERLGSGGFGEVWKVEAPGGIFKAIKIIHGDLRNRETDSFRFAEQELKALKRVKQIRHPYLLALDRIDVVEGRLMIVMELADCNLWDRFRECRKAGHPGIPRDELLQYMAEAAEVLDLMYDQFQLQHLDIKPQNLFLLYNHVKVADFGQVKDLQDMVASVTGGITPVYAAPETFDGFVSRYCDQYSLACVYQELLTGRRPFDGSSIQQLLMQHLQMPPDLNPVPPCDRAVLSKALAKKPEERFTNISVMVAALRAAGEGSGRLSDSAYRAQTGIPNDSSSIVPGLVDTSFHLPGKMREPPVSFDASDLDPQPTPPAMSAPRSSMGEMALPDRVAPPELSGSGSVRPALILGAGWTAQRVLQRFRKQIHDLYGANEKIPSIRTLYIDTDPDAASAASVDHPGNGLSGLGADEVFLAQLYRAGHYVKPRLHGRSVIEGWFDPQLLYKLPRQPTTMGMRAFGRLAFCDHFRSLSSRIQGELELALEPESIARTLETTGGEIRTNRPCVYIVVGLGGGTGSGMFLDLAYATRLRLNRLGYPDPEIIGLLVVPPEGPAYELSQQLQANTYAALTELHHFSRPGSTFKAHYDERAGSLEYQAPPFSQVFVFPGPQAPLLANPGSNPRLSPASIAMPTKPQSSAGFVLGDGRSGTRLSSAAIKGDSRIRPMMAPPTADQEWAQSAPLFAVADFVRSDLFSPIVRTASERRPRNGNEAMHAPIRTCGMTRYTWPRGEVVARATRMIAPVLLRHWVAADPNRSRTIIPDWAMKQWTRLGLDPERITARITDAADHAAGRRISDVIAETAGPLMPKGWLAKLPEPEQVTLAIDKWVRILGTPQSSGTPRMKTVLGDAIVAVADELTEAARFESTNLFHGLIEAPLFRLAGTEEAVHRILTELDRHRLKLEQQQTALELGAAVAFDHLTAYANYKKGLRKISSSELTAALNDYPNKQFQSLLTLGILRVYKKLRDVYTEFMTEIGACRMKVEGYHPLLKAEAEVQPPPVNPGEMLPPLCTTTEDAAQIFIKSLSDDDLTDLDARVQEALERTYGGLFEACINTGTGPYGLLKLMKEEVRAYLNKRLGDVDFATMFSQNFGARDGAVAELGQALERAMPPLLGNGPWSSCAVTVFAAPAGAGGEPILELARNVMPEGTPTVSVRDEVVVYREFSDIPIAALPQLGPSWSAAYRNVGDIAFQPHARLDITQWSDVDKD